MPAALGQLTCQLPQQVTVPVHSWKNWGPGFRPLGSSGVASLGGPGLGSPNSLDRPEATLVSTSISLARLPSPWNALPTLESGSSTWRTAWQKGQSPSESPRWRGPPAPEHHPTPGREVRTHCASP